MYWQTRKTKPMVKEKFQHKSFPLKGNEKEK